MITISDKRFGELLKNSMLLDTYRGIADGQYEVIRKQEEASVAGMAEIKRLREELKATQEKAEMYKRNQDFVVGVNKEISIRSMTRAREIDTLREELADAREQVEYWKQVVNDCERAVVFWREKFTEKLTYSKSLEEAIEGVRNSVKGL